MFGKTVADEQAKGVEHARMDTIGSPFGSADG